jgi:uncharacterized protein (TIGR02996 family)
MGERQAFFDAITAAPDDDGPRLVFADWLDEHGERERAEFIRVQCELARLPDDDKRAKDLRQRSQELQAEHEADWLGEWSGRLVRWTFRRGFLDEVVVTPGPFLAHGGELFRDHAARGVAFVGADGTPVAEDVVPELAGSPHLPGRLRLVFDEHYADDGARQRLWACRRLAVGEAREPPTDPERRLAKLVGRVKQRPHSRAAMSALLASPDIHFLEALHLGSAHDGPAGLRLLAESPPARLRDLVIGSATDPEAVAALRDRFGPRLRVFADC